MTTQEFTKLALSFPEVEQAPHFERTSFRVKKKIFATLHEQKAIATLKLSEMDQFGFCSGNGSMVYPVPGKWGQQGWTFVELNKASQKLVEQILNAAWSNMTHSGSKKKSMVKKTGRR